MATRLKPFFHALSMKQIERRHITFKQARENYRQPDWCQEPIALEPLGCWGLTGGYVHEKGEAYCRSCESYRRANDAERTKAKRRKG